MNIPLQPAPPAGSAGSRCGFVGVAGEPNVGKSTLLNRLIGEELAIVSPRPQTTWQVVRGILTQPAGQVIFVDTPGIHHARDPLSTRMVADARSALFDADLNYWMIDCREDPEKAAGFFSSLPRRVPAFLVINKVDLIPRNRLLPLIEQIRGIYPFREIVPVSALKNENIDRLLGLTWHYLPAGPPLFPPDQLSDQPEREIVKEFIREQVFLLTRQEVPYSTAVKIEEMREQPGRKKLFIRALIIVERPAQRAIILGRGGTMAKRIGSAARKKIESLLGVGVFLELKVLVREKWRQKTGVLRDLGFIK